MISALLVIEAGVMLHTFAKDMRIRAIRIKGTGQLPELMLAEGRKYHLL